MKNIGPLLLFLLIAWGTKAAPLMADEPVAVPPTDTVPSGQAVRVWEEKLVLPTYEKGPDNPNPMFFRGQSYQGASRVLYPYPAQDNLTSEKVDQTYQAVYLENEYVKVCILPEIGGRLFYATDKTNDYEMFYRQSVIKPAHIGMLGAWISGGIEWCVFHHHRASTYLPVDYKLSENEDGSATVWIGEFEPRHRMRWTIGVTLRPGSSAIEADIRMFNRTPHTQSFLYWANVATHVNDDYQIIFSPSTQVGTYHAKNQFIHWPIAKGEYLGRDYDGVDVSWWKNHPGHTSIFGHDLKDGFLAGYDHGKHAGTMHVANPHIVPGAKLWEWGRENTWDSEILTDTDGHYAELMAGAYSDNQPDYSWIGPGETKMARQVWYPLRDIRGVKAANENAAVNLEVKDGKAFIGVNVTKEYEGVYRAAGVVLSAKGETIYKTGHDISPDDPLTLEIELPDGLVASDLELTVLDGCPYGEPLISYQPVEHEPVKELPEPVQPPKKPEEIESVEELYLTGLRIKQFHNARLNPNDYFLEAIKRDPGDSRSNIQLGIDAARRAMYDDAEQYFKNAIDRISKDYTRPRDCEAYYQLGLVQKAQEKYDAAYENLYRAVWDYEFRSQAYAQLAEIDCCRGDFETALKHIDEALAVNALDVKSWGRKAMILRRQNRPTAARQSAERALEIDPLDHFAAQEYVRSLDEFVESHKAAKNLFAQMQNESDAHVELAADYMACGDWYQGYLLLRLFTYREDAPANSAMIHYYMAYCLDRCLEGEPGPEALLLGSSDDVAEQLQEARNCPTGYCFPFRLESLKVFDWALQEDPTDSRAHYYRGCVLYDLQPERAMEHWRKAVELKPTLAIAHRNLGFGYAQAGELEEAIASYEEALRQKADDPVYYAELDVLLERANAPIEKRLALFEGRHDIVEQYEKSLVREIMVWVRAGRYDAAIRALTENRFHAQEGSRGLHELHVDAHLLRGLTRLKGAKKHVTADDYQKALEDFQAADTYPANQQIVAQSGYWRDPQVMYYTALALEGLGREIESEQLFEQVARSSPGSSQRYYQALALLKLGEEKKAQEAFASLVKMGEDRLVQTDNIDFFAKFGSGQSKAERQAEGHFLIGLGLLGQSETIEAEAEFAKACALDASHVWAAYHAADGRYCSERDTLN